MSNKHKPGKAQPKEQSNVIVRKPGEKENDYQARVAKEMQARREGHNAGKETSKETTT
jgi:hypothetical protein